MTLRTFDNRFAAEAAAEQLKARGIAVLCSARGCTLGIPCLRDNHVFDLVLLDRSREAAARRFLCEFDAEAGNGPGWEAEARPDLRCLSPGFGPHCPGCGTVVEARTALERCPACGIPTDVASLIVEQFGPEALGPCYAEPPEHAAAPDAGRFRCRSCRYDLRGLAREGICPECGGPYSKPALSGPRTGS